MQQDASKQLPAMSKTDSRQPKSLLCTHEDNKGREQQAQRRNHKIVESKREVIVVSGRTGMS